MKILVSEDGEIYKEYSNASWGNKNGEGNVIKPGEAIDSKASIITNALPDTTNLSDVAIREFEKKQLMTVYAFPKAGDYYLKASLAVPNKNGKKK